MDTKSEQVWARSLTRALLQRPAEPVLLLWAGAAGTGKTWRLRRLLADPELGAVPTLRLRRGVGGLALDQPPEAFVPTQESVTARDVTPGDVITQLTGPRRDGGPLLLVVEDLHRATGSELAALRGLFTNPPPAFAAVLTYRPEELATPGLPLGASVDYPTELAVLRHQVGPLSEKEVAELACAALGAEHCPEGFVSQLWRRSGGVARVVVDLLRVLTDTQETGRRRTVAHLDRAGVPVRLAELVLGRAVRLPEPDQLVLLAAGVLARPASLRELLAVAGLEPAEGNTALAGALRSGVLASLGPDLYGFAVPLAARAVYEELPGPPRQELHARAAAVLARQRPVPWGELAEHRREGGQLTGWAKAVEHAARDSARAGEHQVAARLLEEALAQPRLPYPTRVRLAPLLARSAVVGLRSDQTVRVLRGITDDETLPVAVRGKVRLDLGLLLSNQLGEGARGRAEMERAVEELRDQPALTARVMSALAIPYWPTATLSVCLEWLARAERAAAASGETAVRIAVAANKVSVLLGTGDPEGWRLLDELPRADEDPSHAQHVARGLCNCADAAVLLGYYERGAELLAEGITHSRRSGAHYQEQAGHGTALLLDWALGRWAGLPARCEELVSEFGEMPVIVEDARVVLGLLALARGDWAQTVHWLSGRDFPSAQDGSVPMVAAASGALIRLALARDDLAGARVEATAAWQRVRGSQVWVWAAELAPWVVEATARAGEVDAVRELVAEFERGLRGRDAPAASAALVWCRARLAEEERDWSRAVRLYGETSQRYAELGRRYVRALTVEAGFRSALAGGDPPDPAVTAELVAVAEELSELGATWDASRARALLRAHQPPSEERRPPGRPGYGDQLSPREREVAELAATGLTNREIATTLHLSPRTVEQHVARAMRKLGTQSRQELAEACGTTSAN